MALRVKCKCGKVLNVPSKLADKRIACPGCKKPFSIPLAKFQAAGKPKTAPAITLAPYRAAEPAIADLSGTIGLSSSGAYDDIGLEPPAPLAPMRSDVAALSQKSAPGPVCPSCKRSLPSGAKICVTCGIDAKTGRSLLTSDEGNLDQTYIVAERTIGIISWFIWLGLYPIASEGYGGKKPWAVRSIATLTVLASLAFFATEIADSPAAASCYSLMLWSGKPEAAETFDDFQKRLEEEEGELDAEALASLREEFEEFQKSVATAQFQPHQLLTHALFHGGLIHLAGNMLFLIVFGSRVNALIGNIATFFLYPVLAIGAGWAHYLSTTDEALHPMLGASGAIMGLAGMYFVFFPVHRVHMAAWIRLGLIARFRLFLKLFALRGFWVVLFYIAFDVAFTVMGAEDGVAHWAHLGGFIAGVAAGLILLLTRRFDAKGGDLLSAILGKHAWVLIGRPGRFASASVAS